MTKITKFELFFLIIFIPIFSMLAYHNISLRQKEISRIQYNNALDHATENALSHMIEYDSTDQIIINKDAAVSNFFSSAYNGLGITESTVSQSWLALYTPVILITDTDGFYVYYSYDAVTDSGETFLAHGWSEKKTYTYQSDQYTISFTTSDDMRIYDTSSGILYDGNYHDLLQSYPALSVSLPFLNNEQTLANIKNTCMSDAISDTMAYYINEHNRIADSYGIKYDFFLPTITDDDWERAINGLAMIVVFQGYPYPSTRGYFNMVEVAGARITKSSSYYISNMSGGLYYHRNDCIYLSENDKLHPYASAFACAKAGAQPCNFCNP
jgi:hypothetical protein